MIIVKRSPFSGKINSMNIPVTQEQLDKWKGGTLIQMAMPFLSSSQREFIMTGITAQEWADTFSSQ